MNLENGKVMLGTFVGALLLVGGFTWRVSSYAQQVSAASQVQGVQIEGLRREMELRFQLQDQRAVAQDARLSRMEQELSQIRAVLDKNND